MSEEISNPAPVETPQVDSAPAPDAVPAPTEGTPVDQAPAYEPNFKFKVMDQEHEIPEAFRTIIKDSDSEKMAREIFEKAYGLDHVKPKYEMTKKELEELRNEYNPIKGDLEILSQLLKNKDYGPFFQSFGLTDEDIINHAMSVLEYHQLPPEKRQAMDAQKAQSLKYYKAQQELDVMKQQQAQQELNTVHQELQSFVKQPHIQGIADSFNARAGQQDAFERAVIAHAQNHFAQTKQDLSVQQAIESFIKLFGLVGQPSQAPAQAGAPASAQPAERKATLPKGGTSTASPVKPKVKTIDDLRKLQRESFEHGHG